MTLNVRHSKVYGTEDWFNGDPDVYSITEAEAFCEPEVELVRNCMYFRTGEYVFSDQNPSADFSNRNNLVCRELATYESGSTTVGYMVVSSNDYVYYIRGNTNSLVRHHVQTNTNVTVTLGRNTSFISLIAENKICYASNYYEDENWNLYLYDFVEETDELLISIPGYIDTEEMTYDIAYPKVFSYAHNGIVKTLFMLNGYRYRNDYEYYDAWYFMSLYNHSTGEVSHYNTQVVSVLDDGSLGGVTPFNYCSPAFINNKFIMPLSVGNEIVDHYELPIIIYDFDADDFYNVVIPLSETWGSGGTYGIGIDTVDNYVYFDAYHRQDGIDHSLCRFNPSNDEYTWIADTNTDYFWVLGERDAFVNMWEGGPISSNFFARDLDNVIFYSDRPFLNADYGSSIYWTKDLANSRFVGYPLGGGDSVTFPVTIPNGVFHDVLASHHGNKIIVNCNKLFTPRKTSLYVIFNQE